MSSLPMVRRRPPGAVVPTPDDEFEEFWVVYPRHAAKQVARIAYAKARRGEPGRKGWPRRTPATASEILVGARSYAAARGDDDPTFTAHPATWLNQSRWEDEPEVARNARVPVRGSVRAVLEREVFAGSGDPARRTIHFLRCIMPRARELGVRGADDVGLARHLARFQVEIEGTMGSSRRSSEVGQGGCELLWEYVDWVGSRDWSGFTLSVFSMGSKAFDQWRSEKARGDPDGRDPLTGRSGR